MHKIGIVGGGYLGNRIHGKLVSSLIKSHINNLDDCELYLKDFDVIINCAGHIGTNNVDECENDKQKTLASNVFLPITLGEYCLQTGKKLIHIGSGCVYNFNFGKQLPITETDEPDYYDLYYSRTKVYAEKVLEYMSRKFDILVLRIRIPLDYIPHPKNILNKLIKYKTVIDAHNSITYIPDLIRAIGYLIFCSNARGVFNVTNNGSLYYPALLDEYKKYKLEFEYKLMFTKDLNLKRTNLLMNSTKLANAGFKMRYIKDVIPECIKKYVSYGK